jgi:hypothetical protein
MKLNITRIVVGSAFVVVGVALYILGNKRVKSDQNHEQLVLFDDGFTKSFDELYSEPLDGEALEGHNNTMTKNEWHEEDDDTITLGEEDDSEEYEKGTILVITEDEYYEEPTSFSKETVVCSRRDNTYLSGEDKVIKNASKELSDAIFSDDYNVGDLMYVKNFRLRKLFEVVFASSLNVEEDYSDNFHKTVKKDHFED